MYDYMIAVGIDGNYARIIDSYLNEDFHPFI